MIFDRQKRSSRHGRGCRTASREGGEAEEGGCRRSSGWLGKDTPLRAPRAGDWTDVEDGRGEGAEEGGELDGNRVFHFSFAAVLENGCEKKKDGRKGRSGAEKGRREES